MLIYSIVKGFAGEFEHIQRNAVRSWQTVFPQAQIVWFGQDEPGAAEEAEANGIQLMPMRRTEKGAPLLPDVIDSAHKLARSRDTRCLINADIVLEPQFATAVQAVEDRFSNFLLITRRRNIQVDDELDFSEDWHGMIKDLPFTDYTRSGIDVFCYRGDWLRDIPPFGVGRTAWDNWIVSWADKQEKLPIIDATGFTVVYHQQHAKHKPQGEVMRNQAIWQQALVEFEKPGTLNSATWKLTEKGQLVEKGA